jgi:hypothetical protein
MAKSNGFDNHLGPLSPSELSDIRKRLAENQRTQAQLNRSKELEYRSDRVKWIRQGSLIEVRARAEAIRQGNLDEARRRADELLASPPLIEWAITPTRWPL